MQPIHITSAGLFPRSRKRTFYYKSTTYKWCHFISKNSLQIARNKNYLCIENGCRKNT